MDEWRSGCTVQVSLQLTCVMRALYHALLRCSPDFILWMCRYPVIGIHHLPSFTIGSGKHAL